MALDSFAYWECKYFYWSESNQSYGKYHKSFHWNLWRYYIQHYDTSGREILESQETPHTSSCNNPWKGKRSWKLPYSWNNHVENTNLTMIWLRHCLTICMSAVWFLSHIQSQSNYSVSSEIISCDSSLLSQLHLQLRVNHSFIETEWLIYASVDQTTMVSDNDSPPVQCPVISLTNDGVLNIRHYVIYPNEMSLEIKFLYEIELKNVGCKSVVILSDFYALINDETHMVFFYSRLLKQHSSGTHQNTNKDFSAKLEVRLQTMVIFLDIPLPWRHNDHDGVSNRQPHDCLLNRLFRRR